MTQFRVFERLAGKWVVCDGIMVSYTSDQAEATIFSVSDLLAFNQLEDGFIYRRTLHAVPTQSNMGPSECCTVLERQALLKDVSDFQTYGMEMMTTTAPTNPPRNPRSWPL